MIEHLQRSWARHVVRALACAALAASVPVYADNWPQFRGPGGRGLSSETGLPVVIAENPEMTVGPSG